MKSRDGWHLNCINRLYTDVSDTKERGVVTCLGSWPHTDPDVLSSRPRNDDGHFIHVARDF